jgi:hypothetical protein
LFVLVALISLVGPGSKVQRLVDLCWGFASCRLLVGNPLVYNLNHVSFNVLLFFGTQLYLFTNRKSFDLVVDPLLSAKN